MAFTEIETGFAASVGLDEIANEQRPFALAHNVSFGDLWVPSSSPRPPPADRRVPPSLFQHRVRGGRRGQQLPRRAAPQVPRGPL